MTKGTNEKEKKKKNDIIFNIVQVHDWKKIL